MGPLREASMGALAEETSMGVLRRRAWRECVLGRELVEHGEGASTLSALSAGALSTERS